MLARDPLAVVRCPLLGAAVAAAVASGLTPFDDDEEEEPDKVVAEAPFGAMAGRREVVSPDRKLVTRFIAENVRKITDCRVLDVERRVLDGPQNASVPLAA